MKIFDLVLVALLLIPVAAYDSAAQNGTAESKPLVPLAIGNAWTMRVTMFEPRTQKKEITTSERIVIGTVTMLGRTWYRLQGDEKAGDGTVMLLANDSAGLGVSYESGRVGHYPYPAKVGVIGQMPDEAEIRLVAIDSSITVPAGTFQCWVYEISGDRYALTQRVAYAPGVGQILTVAEYGIVTVRSELVSYTVRGGE